MDTDWLWFAVIFVAAALGITAVVLAAHWLVDGLDDAERQEYDRGARQWRGPIGLRRGVRGDRGCAWWWAAWRRICAATC
jgi:hypothetical protein